jgi:flagellar motor switch protein FliG
MVSSSIKDYNGREKAAMLLVALGPELSASIFRHLKEEEMEQLTLEIANLRLVGSEVKEKVLEEFFEICLAQEYISEGGIAYAKEILEKALGPEKALDVLNKLTVSLQVKPFDVVRKADPTQILNFIQSEHPQTIALILAYLKPVQSAAVLSALPPDRQADVARRIAKMDRTSPEVVKEVERILEKKLSSLVNQDFTVVGGLSNVVDILNNVDRSTERHIMEALEIEDTDLAEEIKKRMFVFEDILLLDDRSVQRFLREIENNMLALGLKMATDELKDLIFRNMSKRMSEMIQEDMEFMGPVRIKDVEEAQQNIVNIIRKLEDTGEIVISRGGGDEVIV